MTTPITIHRSALQPVLRAMLLGDASALGIDPAHWPEEVRLGTFSSVFHLCPAESDATAAVYRSSRHPEPWIVVFND